MRFTSVKSMKPSFRFFDVISGVEVEHAERELLFALLVSLLKAAAAELFKSLL